MSQALRKKVIEVVAKHHNVSESEILDETIIQPEVRRSILDELVGPELGSTSRLSVKTLIVCLEALQNA